MIWRTTMNRQTRHLWTGALLATLLIAGCSGKGDTVFKLRKIVIDTKNVVSEAHRIELKNMTKADDDLAEQALRNLVLRGLVLEKALDESEKTVLARIARRKADQECITLGKKKELNKRWNLQEESRQAFEENPARFQLPESFRLQMIFLPNHMKNAPALAGKLLRELKAEPGRFADLARTYSQAENASRGGITASMPGSGVAPALRSAISRHSEDRSPFLVKGPGGLFILKILDYWPPPGGTYDQLAARVQEQVSRELMAGLDSEIRAGVEKYNPVSIDQNLFVRPLVGAQESCLRVGQEDVLVSDLLLEENPSFTVTGPQLRKMVRKYRNYRDACSYFDCPEPTPSRPSDVDIVALRMESFLDNYVETRMADELQHFFQIHRGAFRTSPRLRFDAWVFPFAGRSPLEAREAHQSTLDRIIRDEKLEPAFLKEHGGSFFGDVEMSMEQIYSWVPDLAGRILDLEPGKDREIFRSRALHADLILRIKSKTPPRDLEFKRPEDRSIIVRTFIRDNRDEILDSLYQRALKRGRFFRQNLQECRKELEAAE